MDELFDVTSMDSAAREFANVVGTTIGWKNAGTTVAYDYRVLIGNPQKFVRDGGRVITVYMKYADGRAQPYERINVAFVWSGKGDPSTRHIKDIIQDAVIAAESLGYQQKKDISDSTLLDVIIWTGDEVLAYAHGAGLHSVRYLLCPNGQFVAPNVIATYSGSNVQKLNQKNPPMLAVLMSYFQSDGVSLSDVERTINHLPIDELFRFYLLALGVVVDPTSIADALDTSRALAVKGDVQVYHAKAQIDYQSGQLVVVPLELDAKLFQKFHLIGADVHLQINASEEPDYAKKESPKPKRGTTNATGASGELQSIAQKINESIQLVATEDTTDGHVLNAEKINQLYAATKLTAEGFDKLRAAVESSRKKSVENLNRGKSG